MPWPEKLNRHLTPKRERIALIALVVLYAFFLCYNINAPFIGTSEAFNGQYGIAAANWVRLGPLALSFTEMTPFGAEVIKPEITKNFFLSHPQFFITPAAIIYWLFGIGNWQTRLGPIIFSLLDLALFWAIIKRKFKTPSLTVISSLFFIFFPVTIYYGRMLIQEPVTIFFVLALFWATLAFEEKRAKKYLVLLCLAAFLGGLMDWEFFFAAAGVWGYVALQPDYPRRKLVLLLLILMVAASLGVTLLQIWSILRINPISFLTFIFLDRAKRGPISEPLTTSLPWYLIMRGNFDLINFSELGLILATVGATSYFLAHKQNRDKILFAALLLAPGVLTYLVFRGLVATHQFPGFYFAPPIAFLAAWAITHMRKAWLAGIMFAIFAVSCLWYASGLLTYKSFADDDFAMLKRANLAVPADEGICMGQNAVNTNIKFYLFPHQLDDSPCPASDKYFVLQQPTSFALKDPNFSLLGSFLNGNFWSNLQRVSFTTAAAMEVIKATPVLKEKIQKLFLNRDPHGGYLLLAKYNQGLIDANNLRPVDCATYFCLYKKE